MHAPTGRPSLVRRIDAPRVFAAALVTLAHVLLLLAVQFAMRPDALDESAEPPESTLTVEFMEAQPALPPVARESPALPPSPSGPAIRRKPTPVTSKATTSVEFIGEAPVVAAPEMLRIPLRDAHDRFDAPVPHKPFPRNGLFAPSVPKPTVRLPDRPSMMQAYWAVPEGENLQGKLARTVPLARLLLAATGAIGVPHCPPKSEHPECLQRLVDDQPR